MKTQGRVLALIPARGGSKGLPGKNIRELHGKPLLAWTILAAQRASVIDEVIVSSDDDRIIGVAREWGCRVPFRRPDHLANDTAGAMDVVFHALDQLPGFQTVILLQPTSPMRTAEDIQAAFSCFTRSGAPSCVSVCAVAQSPYQMYHRSASGHLSPVIASSNPNARRQDVPEVFRLNGAIYIADVTWLRATRSFVATGCISYEMDPRRSVDIDSAEDFERCRATMERTDDAP